MEGYIKKFTHISVADMNEVGAKNAFLGEIFTHIALKDIKVPEGFAITSTAFRRFIAYNKLDGVHAKLLAQIDRNKNSNIGEIGKKARGLILGARMPGDLSDCISAAYHELSAKSSPEVAVRSSAIYEDLFHISVKDKHETYLNIQGEKALLEWVKKCFASLYSDKALRSDFHKDYDKVIAVGVQKMIRADKGCSGFAYTVDPLSGFTDVIHLSGVWGLGEKMVEERITPDEFIVYKPILPLGKKSIIQKTMGSKSRMMVYNEDTESVPVVEIETPGELKEKFVLTDEEILTIANWGMTLESYYNSPMGLEWAKDGNCQELYLLQAKPKNFKRYCSLN